MAETLAMTRAELRAELGFRFGVRRDPERWSPDWVLAIDSAVRSGLRRILLNTVSPGTRKNYRWSFLHQTFRFRTVVDVDHYDLPNDFGHVDGPLLHDDTAVSYRPITIVNEIMLDRERARDPSANTRPYWAAVRAKRTDITEQQYELLLFPTPDAVYPMRLGYQVNPEMLTEDVTQLPGGAAMSRAILYACLAESGHLIDDNAKLEAVYQDALAAAISYDSRQDGGFLGINGDPSISEEYRPRYLNPNAYTVTIDGLSGV